jgi:hypothetical protein
MTRFTARSAPLLATLAATLLAGSVLGAQTRAHDPSARLRAVLPADVAERVLARIADARARQLPAAALENRALKFAAKGVAPADVERSVADHAGRMAAAKAALAAGRRRRASDDEVEAGADAMRQGVDGATVSALAQGAPSGRSLAVPLSVVGGLVDRGLPADAALRRVQARLQARASDADLQTLPAGLAAQGAAGQARRPRETGRALGATKRAAAGGARGRAMGRQPSGVPANGSGSDARPAKPAGRGRA